MLPRNLKVEDFAGYPPDAKKLAMSFLPTLRKLPLSFLAAMLREVIEFDFKFPVERKARERELDNLSSLSDAQLQEWFQGFAEISLSPQLEEFDWVKAPAQFVERLSAHLWSTHQIDAFRSASNRYADRLLAVVAPEPLPVARLGITVIGQGVSSYEDGLFRKLRPHGAYYTRVKPEDGLRQLLDAVAARAKSHAAAYGHWYIDGGEAVAHDAALTCVSYAALEPVRTALLRKMQEEIDRPGMGPEALRTLMNAMAITMAYVNASASRSRRLFFAGVYNCSTFQSPESSAEIAQMIVVRSISPQYDGRPDGAVRGKKTLKPNRIFTAK